MPIGEFAGAPAAVGGHGPMYATPAYWFYEMSQASLNPARAWADASRLFFKNPANPDLPFPFYKEMSAPDTHEHDGWKATMAGLELLTPAKVGPSWWPH